MNLVQPKKPFVPSVDRQHLVDVLRAAQPGGVVTFEALSAAIGRNVLEFRWLLDSARRKARDQHSVVFEAVVGIGLRRLPNEEIPQRGPKAFKKARRAVLRGAKDVKAADYDALPADGKMQFNLSISLSGALMLMTKPSRTKKLEAATSAHGVPPAETLRLFLTAKKPK